MLYRTEKLSVQQFAAITALKEALPEVEFWNRPALGKEVKTRMSLTSNIENAHVFLLD